MLKEFRQKIADRPFLMVLIIWFFYGAYLVLLATPQYESESKLVIKANEGGSSFDPSSLLLSSVSIAPVSEDSSLLEAYIYSRDMLSKVDTEIALREHFMSRDADLFSRLSQDHSEEDFYDFYLDHIIVNIDANSSVISITTRAFSETYAQQFNRLVIKHAEDFMNQIGYALAEKKLQFAGNEHQIVERKLQDAKQQLLAFQSTHHVLDPSADGLAMQQIAFSLEATLAQKKAELSMLQTIMSETAPEVAALKRQLVALQSEINRQKSKVSTMEDDHNGLAVNELMAQYSNLKVQAELALQAYTASLVTLEKARVDAYQQLKFLVLIQHPTMPDDYSYPRTTYSLLLMAVALLMLYGIGRVVVATIREL